MKILLSTIILFSWLLSQPVQAVSFKRQVNRLEAPVLLTDVLVADEKYLQNMPWPKDMHGWVSKEQVASWLSAKADKPFDVKGFKRVWVEWCYPAELDKAMDSATSEIKSLLEEAIQVSRIEPSQSHTNLCFKEKAVSSQWLSFEKVKGTRFVGALQFQFDGMDSIEKTFMFNVEATVNALVLKVKGKRQQPISRLKVKSKRVSWSGDELFDSQMLAGYQLKKTLARRTILKMSHFDVVEDIPKGQSIKVKVSYGAIEINTTGTALTAGSVGQKIKIRVNGSDEVNEGQVIEKGVVHVSV